MSELNPKLYIRLAFLALIIRLASGEHCFLRSHNFTFGRGALFPANNGSLQCDMPNNAASSNGISFRKTPQTVVIFTCRRLLAQNVLEFRFFPTNIDLVVRMFWLCLFVFL